MTGSQEAFDLPTPAEIRRDPEKADLVMTHLTFEKATENITDLRSCVPGLEKYPNPISPESVIVDSDMSLPEAFSKLSEHCPDEILTQQELIPVHYFSEDGKLHRGQVVIHSSLVEDVGKLFKLLVEHQLPIHSMIPLSDPRFVGEDGQWDDELSMQDNNGSAFNYRQILTPTGEVDRLSIHAVGMALDLNPVWNPCYGEPSTHILDLREIEAAAGYTELLPVNGEYNLMNRGSFHNRHPVVILMKELGWLWGGEWGEPKDLHHFQKTPEALKDWVAKARNHSES